MNDMILAEELTRLVERLEVENDYLKSIQLSIMRNDFLIALLRNKQTDIATFQNGCRMYDICFNAEQAGQYAVLSFVFDDKRDILENCGSPPVVEEVLQMGAVMNDYKNTYLNDFCVEMSSVGNIYLFIFNILEENSDSDVIAEICVGTKSVLDALSDERQAYATAEVSRIFTGIGGIYNAYQDLKSIWEYRRMLEEETPVCSFNDLSHTNKAPSLSATRSYELERQFLNCIQIGDFYLARDQMNQLVLQMFVENPPSIQILMLRVYELMNSMLVMLSNLDRFTDSQFISELEVGRRILDAESLTQLIESIDYIFDRLFEYIESRSTEKAPRWFPELLRIIEEDYCDPNISVGMLSGKLCLTATHMSRVFKRNMGTSLPGYIHTLRIARAKELLAKGKSVKEVAAEVGYTCQLTMARAFKKIDGTTPGSYGQLTRQR